MPSLKGDRTSRKKVVEEKEIMKDIGTVLIEVPIAEENGKYAVRHVDIQCDDLQAIGLRRITDALNEKAVKLRNGRYVQSPAETLKYIIELILDGE